MLADSDRALLKAVACVAVGALGVAFTRGPVIDAVAHAQETSDVYVLPPPAELVPLSLGFRAALADVLWASVLVSQGLHMQAKRHYDNVVQYLDAINALDPTFRDPYMNADALITFQVGEPSREEVYKTREILERGSKNLPLDAEIWMNLGGFVAYVAPASYLHDGPERERWRLDGARYLARAAELAGKQTDISVQALGGAGILDKAGERSAAVNFYRRACAVTDDPGFKQECDLRLTALLGAELADKYRDERRAFEAVWRRDLPISPLTELLVLGPPRDTAYCAGGVHEDDPRCAATWQAWREHQPAPTLAPPAK